MERCDKPANWVSNGAMFLCDSCHVKENPNHFALDRFVNTVGKCDKPTETIEQFKERQEQGVPQKSTDWR